MSRRSIRWNGMELLKELSEAFGVSGFEEEVRARIRAKVAPLVDEVQVDRLGNLHAILNPEEPFTLMLDAHMDEVGFVVKSTEEGGFLRLAPIGGWDVRLLPGQAVLVRGRGGDRYWGVAGSIPPHVQEEADKNKVLGWKDLFVDVGARDLHDLQKMGVRVGSPALLHQPFRMLGEGAILGKALDDRAGCAVLIRILEALSMNRPSHRVVATFATTEEVGCRGARVAARRWEPQMALIVEGTMATDTPGVRADQRVASLGLGPVVTAVDRSLIVPERLVEAIIKLAEDAEIPWQMKTPMVGSTDGGVIHMSAQGILTAVLSVPCRYIHSPGCLMRFEDLRHTERLVEAFVRDAPKIYDEICEP